MNKHIEDLILEFARREVQKVLNEKSKYYRKSKLHPDNLRLGKKKLNFDAHRNKQETEMALLKSQLAAVLQSIEEYPPPEVIRVNPKTGNPEQFEDVKGRELAITTSRKVLRGVTTRKKDIHALASYIVSLGVFPKVPFTSLVRAIVEIFEKR